MHFTVSRCCCQSATPLRGSRADQASALSAPPSNRWLWGPSEATSPEIKIAAVPAPTVPHSHPWSVHHRESNRPLKCRRRQPVGVGTTRSHPVGMRSCRHGAL